MDQTNDNERISILLVEDNEFDRVACRRTLRDCRFDFEIQECHRAEDAIELLRVDPNQFDAILCDYRLPGITALRFFEQLRADGWDRPFVMLTGVGTEKTAVQAMQAGVADYVIKEPDGKYLNALPQVLLRVVTTYRDRQALQRAEQQAHKHSADLLVYQEELEVQNEELRRAQLELQASRDRYADLYDFAPVGYITLDEDDAIVECNLTAASLLGTDRAKLMGASFTQMLDRSSKDTWYHHRQALETDGGRQSCEIEITSSPGRGNGQASLPRKRRKEYSSTEHQPGMGTITDNSLTSFRVGVSDNMPRLFEVQSEVADGSRRIRTVLVDITSRKLAQDDLKIRDRAFNASPIGILITDPRQSDNPIVYCNPAFERMTGYSVDESLGRNCRFLQGDDRDQPALEAVRHAIANGSDARAVLRNYRKDGSMFWNELYLSPVRNEHGTVTHFVGMQNDITARVLAEESARSKDRRLRALADALPALISYLDATFRYQFSSAAYADWFELSPEEMLGQTVHQVLGPHLNEAFFDYLAKARDGQSVTFDCELPHRELGKRFVQVMLIPDEAAGKVVGIHTLGIDVTDRQIIDQQQVKRQTHAENLERLTPGERDVYDLLVAGTANKVIAEKLNVGLRTVERRRQQVYQKMEAQTLAELMRKRPDL